MSGLYTFTWNGPAETVYVTGSFDNWAKSELMDKDPTTGQFSKSVKLPQGKVEYKYLVDGEWELDTTAKTEDNGNGIKNNYLLAGDINERSTMIGMAGTNRGITRATSMPGGFPPDTPNEDETVESTTGILPRGEATDPASLTQDTSAPSTTLGGAGVTSTVPSMAKELDTGSVPSEYYTSREMDAKDSSVGGKTNASSQDYTSKAFGSSGGVQAGMPSHGGDKAGILLHEYTPAGIDAPDASAGNFPQEYAPVGIDAPDSSAGGNAMLDEESMAAGELGTATVFASSSGVGNVYSKGDHDLPYPSTLSNDGTKDSYIGNNTAEAGNMTGNLSSQADNYSSVGREYSSMEVPSPQITSIISEQPGPPASTPAVTGKSMSTVPSTAVIDEKIRSSLPSNEVEESPVGESVDDSRSAPLMDTNLVDSREHEKAYGSEGLEKPTSNSASKPTKVGSTTAGTGAVPSTATAGSTSGAATHSDITGAEAALPSASLAREKGQVESAALTNTPAAVSSTQATPANTSQSSTSTPSKSVDSPSGTTKSEKKKKRFLGKIKKAFQ